MRLLCTRYAMRILHPIIVHRHGGGECRSTPALTLPQGRYGLSLLLLEVLYTSGVDDICRQVQRQ